MRRLSAGLLMFRRGKFGVEVFLVHPGGPLWRKKGRLVNSEGRSARWGGRFDGGTARHSKKRRG
jgi:predicted NUDIX family NTP pyrophosphohydrolase